MKFPFLQTVNHKPSVPPADYSAGTTNGVIVDRLGYGSGAMYVAAGAVGGSPSAISVIVTLQHGNDSGLSDAASISAAAITLTAENTDAMLYLRLAGCKRYVRLVSVVSFTGGTTPSIAVNAGFILGDNRKNKVNTANIIDVGRNAVLANGNW